MSITAPKISEIEQDILSQIGGKLSQTIPALKRGAFNVLARVVAGAWTLQYKYSGWMLLQMFIQHASNEETTVLGKKIRPLQEQGVLKGVSDPSLGTRFTGAATVLVTTQTGSLAAGQTLRGLNNGVIYRTTNSPALSSSTVSVTIEAIEDPNQGGGFGSIGNLVVNDELEFISPTPNVRRTGVKINTVTTVGTDPESEKEYRARVLAKTQKPPQGGAAADYYHWSMEVPGIIDALPYAANPGVVFVAVEASLASSGSADGFPTGSQLTAVADSIVLDQSGLASRLPIGAGLQVASISRQTVDFTIAGLQAVDLAALKIQIEDGLEEYLRSRSPYIVGLSIPPRADIVSQSQAGGIVSDIVNAVNGSFTAFTMTMSGNPLTTYYLEMGEKAKLGNVSYT